MVSILNNTNSFMFLVVVFLLAFNIDSCISVPPRGKTFSGDATFYEVGLGACGKVNNDNQFIVALNHDMFDPSPGNNPNKNKNCGRKMKVSYKKKSVTVTVVDRCGGCKKGDVDLSPHAFSKLADPSVGRMRVKWKFIT